MKPPATPDAEIEARERLARDYLGAWNSHDPEAVAAFFAEDAIYDDRGAGEVCHGRSAIRAHAAAVMSAFPDLRFELVRAAHLDSTTLAQWRCRMTHLGEYSGLAPTGRALESAGVDVAELDAGGSVRHLASYYDGAALMRDLGILPARHSRFERALVRTASLVGGIRRR
jgi:steroid delta-isomerase-like uncharacterized protein